MKVSSCLHPQRVYNKYSKEYVYAPCGRCPECLRHKSQAWTERLNQERYSWKYCVFFTLTYAPEFVPTLKHDEHRKYFYDLSHVHYHQDLGDVIIDRDEIFKDCKDRVERLKLANWIDGQPDGIKYLSVGDAQRFIKRLRITLQRYHKNYYAKAKEDGHKVPESWRDASVRYYLVGEYGETTCRPHMHGLLFFNSEITSSCIEEIISKVWKFGNVDSSFVAESNASYVSGYVNCTTNLPQILLHKRIRPFAIFSKHPFIGSLCHSSKEVKEVFFRASPDHVIFKHEQSAFANVPLWKSYQRQLYPKISGFDRLSHIDRVSLYRAFERYEKITEVPNFLQFFDYVQGKIKGVYTPSLYTEYFDRICEDIKGKDYEIQKRLFNRIYSWFITSCRVVTQARSFEIPTREYVSIIERFYNNVRMSNLKKQYDYETDLVEERGKPLDSAFALDREFVRTICESDLSTLSLEEITALQSFGIDIDKFYSDDLTERERYRWSFLPDTCEEYVALSLDAESWLSAHTKTKRKNDYLEAHPELANVLWSND